MMKIIWTIIKKQKWERKTKHRVFVFFSTVLWGLFGAIIWSLTGLKIAINDYYILAFIGYPAFLGVICSIIFLCNHDTD